MTKPFSITHQVRQFLVVALLLLMSSALTSAQTTTFTYQGRLNDGGAAANGVFDMQFKLYDAADPSASAQIGSTITNSNVAVTNGIFTVRLDFGASALPGANRFLEVGVRRSSSDPYTVLAPRQQVTSAPYAIRSANAVVADQLSTTCVGCVQDAQISSVAGSKLTGPLPAGSIPAGNGNYIQSNPTAQQAGANFNISGSGTAGTLNAATQYNLGGNRVLSIPGTNNTFAGVTAGESNTTGSENSFFGNAAGFSNTAGVSNSFFGLAAGQANTTGSNNAFFGRAAGSRNTLGTANAFFGRSAGILNTTGSNNAFFGRAAGQANTTGSNNAFFGDTAGLNNTASENSFFGNQAGLSNTSGPFNSFFGSAAGGKNTTGFQNAFFGRYAGQANTTGFQNAFFGMQAGVTNMTGSSNAFFGTNAGSSNTMGKGNTFVGTSTGASNTIENNNTFIGANANGAAGITNATAIGAGAQVTSSNTMVLGSNVNVGIGTPTPNSKLTVAGLIETTTGGVKFPDGTIQTTAGGRNSILNQTTQQAGANFNISGNGTLGGTLSASSVGIGTTTPDRQVTILNGSTVASKRGSYMNLKSVNANFISNPTKELLVGADDTGGIVSTMTNDDLQLRAGGNTTKIIIKADGNVGIGTTTPRAKLDVVGNVVADGNVGIGTTTPRAKLDVVGNVVQDRGSNGLIKAMALIKDDNTVVRCYNSQATGAAVTTPPCNIVVTFENTGNYLIDFGFSVMDRYISLTPRTLTDDASAPIDVTAVVVGTNNQNQTRAYFRSPTAGAKSGFFIFVY